MGIGFGIIIVNGSIGRLIVEQSALDVWGGADAIIINNEFIETFDFKPDWYGTPSFYGSNWGDVYMLESFLLIHVMTNIYLVRFMVQTLLVACSLKNSKTNLNITQVYLHVYS